MRASAQLLLLSALVLSGCGCGGGNNNPLSQDGGIPVTGVPNVPWYCFVIPCTDAGMTSPRCNASNCSGCCDVRGLCQTGTANGQCGAQGSACFNCGFDQTCDFGVCQPRTTGRCSDQNCTGCCLPDGTCSLSSTRNLCGTGGSTCFSCEQGQDCINGACQRACNPTNCTGCCDAFDRCVTGDTNSSCGRNGNLCATCPGGSRCDGFRCVTQPQCANCAAGQCCLSGTCVDTGPNLCSRNGVVYAECRVCVSPETCGGGSETGFCVRPGNRPLGSACAWDGDCSAGAGSGRPTCLTGLAWSSGYCSDDCSTTSCMAPDVCRPFLSRNLCMKGCSTPGATCTNPDTICEVLDGGAALGCVPKCTGSTALIQCVSGRCHANGRCCGLSGTVCCDTGQACLGTGRDGGASTCQPDGTCS